MFEEELSISMTLLLLTPMHIGTGRHVAFAGAQTDDAGGPPEAAELCKDGAGRPYIPGATLKGALRSLAEEAGCDGVDFLFGTIKGTSRAGLATFYGAAAGAGKPPDTKEMPYNQSNGLFVSARTAVEAASGTAAEHKLFFREMAAPGWTFDARVALRRPAGMEKDNADWKAAVRLLGDLRATLTREGLVLGKGKADNDGALKLTTSTAKGAFPTPKALATGRTTTIVSLHCPGPFLISDASYDPAASSLAKDDPARVAVRGQRRNTRLALIEGSSISGGLRARMARLEAIDALRAAHSKSAPRLNGATGTLFGSTTQAGRLRLTKLVTENKGPIRLTQVSLDRFTGGPMDQLLFRTEAFTGVRISFALEYPEAHRALVDALLADLKRDGLHLGAGGGKGFGWFDCTIGKTTT